MHLLSGDTPPVEHTPDTPEPPPTDSNRSRPRVNALRAEVVRSSRAARGIPTSIPIDHVHRPFRSRLCRQARGAARLTRRHVRRGRSSWTCLWPIFLLLGWEQVRIEPNANPFLTLDFTSYPWVTQPGDGLVVWEPCLARCTSPSRSTNVKAIVVRAARAESLGCSTPSFISRTCRCIRAVRSHESGWGCGRAHRRRIVVEAIHISRRHYGVRERDRGARPHRAIRTASLAAFLILLSSSPAS